MGLKRGSCYTVEVFMRNGTTTDRPVLCVSIAGETGYYIPYKDMSRFQKDWDFVNT